MDESELMDGDVTIRVTHSTVNYKDGLALSGKSPVIRRFPMVLGVDLAGIVESSRRSDFAPGDEVVLTGYGLSETHFGGYAERARVNGDWLVKLPTGLTRAEAMAIGTAGFTAMLALMAIERHDLTPSAGAALVTGAAGRRRLDGDLALRRQRLAGDRLHGARERGGISQGARRGRDHRPRDAEQPRQAARQGAMGRGGRQRRLDDARQRAGANALRRRGRVLWARRRHGPATTVAPFILRGVSLLGIDSVHCPTERRLEAWRRLALDLDRLKLASMTRTIPLAEVFDAGARILKGETRGRLVVTIP